MKNATNMILNRYPILEKAMKEDTTGTLTDSIDNTFLRLLKFVENPNEQFEINELYSNLNGEELKFALEVINTFFKKDTYLLAEVSEDIYLDGDTSHLYNMSNFAKKINNEGIRFYRQKVNTYLERNKFPQPDIVVSGVKHWKEETVLKYIQELKEKGLQENN